MVRWRRREERKGKNGKIKGTILLPLTALGSIKDLGAEFRVLTGYVYCDWVPRGAVGRGFQRLGNGRNSVIAMLVTRMSTLYAY